jgi:pimeloyl-ACP methyl ester carboxylesterase
VRRIERRVQVAPDVRLAVRVIGDSDPTVLLVHGLASTSALWEPVAERLAAQGCGVALVDLRGHGDSDLPDEGYDTATAARDVVAVVEQVAEPPVVLAGQSWGGNVVLRATALRPDLVGGLALVDGGWIRLAGRFADWPAALAALTPGDIDGWPVARLRGAVAASLAGFPAGSVERAMSVVRVAEDGTVRRRLPVERHLQVLASVWEDDPRVWYPRVQVPTLLLAAVPAHGQLDEEVTVAAAGLARARVRPYPGAHNDLHLQHPGPVSDDLRSLL